MSAEKTVQTLIELFSGYRVGDPSAKRIVSENAAVRQGLESCAGSLVDAPPADLDIVYARTAPR